MLSISDMVRNMTDENPYFIRKGEFADLVDTIDIERVKKKMQRNSRAIFQQPGKNKQDKKRLQASGALGEQGVINIQRRLGDIFETFGEGNLIFSDVSMILSRKGCMGQDMHFDFNIVEKPVETKKSLFCMVALQDNTSLNIRNKETGLVTNVKFGRGDAFFSRGDVIHAGVAYNKDNLRLHWFGDYPNNKRKEGHTYLYDEATNSTSTSEHYYDKYIASRRKNMQNLHVLRKRKLGISGKRADWCRRINKKSL